MKSGTAKSQQYIPIHAVYQKLSKDMVDKLILFHALAGCDTTSYLAGQSIKTEWKVVEIHHKLLSGLDRPILTQAVQASIVKFVCQIYGVPNMHTTDEARVILFK